MHAYPANSPEAVSRILALAMIVDGHVSPSEVQAMHRAAFLEQVKVDDDTFDRTLRELCEDLLDAAANRRAGVVEIDPALLDALLLDIRDPLLQICLWKTMSTSSRPTATSTAARPRWCAAPPAPGSARTAPRIPSARRR
ncbi:TerB family tellurite resistance protein [Massilia sp. 9I]|uniref:TerB family tellurite resistance protein n=1 Tax=Massilia sp. 9I TaxID=2653152 RepID=UPI0012F43795|nr:TerB family tellurite resistance protein [Massilia sp. 9I]VXB42746.1 hypothetical protein MASSI9I_20720 [Massilia sp. 9I]